MAVDPRYAMALRQLESSGNYAALGPVVTKGTYAGDRAYGAYQVMGKNIPSWTQEALGVQMTPAQFLADSKAQDAVFNYQFGKSLDKYGNPADAASVWHSGRPLAKAAAAGATDGYMETKDYVAKFMGYAENGVSAKAAAGWSTGVPTDLGGTDYGGAVASLMPGVTAKNDAFAALINTMSDLRQQADVTSQIGQSSMNQLPQPKIRNMPVMQSQALAQPIQVTPAYIN